LWSACQSAFKTATKKLLAPERFAKPADERSAGFYYLLKANIDLLSKLKMTV
jgi:hypothetical protein